MNYKLAKQLKDAGFPQEFTTGDKYYHFVAHPRVGIPPQYSEGIVISDIPFAYKEAVSDWIKKPTLEELIDDCVARFDEFKLELIADEGLLKYEARGSVFIDDTLYKEKIINEVHSVAVVKLWLKLNGKY